MNPDYPPILLPTPVFLQRSKEKPRQVPPDPQILEKRVQISDRLSKQVSSLSADRRKMSDTERKAVFYKLTHERPINLSGTELQIICEPGDHTSLAIASEGTIDFKKFEKVIQEFGKDEETAKKVYNQVAPLHEILYGNPKDRLCESLFRDYENLVQAKGQSIIIEIEIAVPLLTNIQEIRRSLENIRKEVSKVLGNGVHGSMFEHEESYNTCRAVIRCNGKAFRELVENQEWQTKIFWFDSKPEFETLHTILEEFEFAKLAPIESPNESAQTVCIVDSGVTKGNPFLTPICKSDSRYFKSFLRKDPTDPNDHYGHGTGVASLASYYALNIAADAQNSGKVWVACARVLDENNKCEDETLFSKVLQEVVEYFVPLGVRIFNLSLSIINRYWNEEQKRTIPRKSWIARKIDELSRKHDIVFVICTGNIALKAVNNAASQNIHYPQYFLDEYAALFDPAQSALALSVGALSPPTRIVGRAASLTAVASNRFPAPFTRKGPGIGKEIKPEVVEYGGNYVRDTATQHISSNPGTDVVVASHQLTPALTHGSGTSFAAPRVSHHLALILQDLIEMEIANPSSALLKALLVNSALPPREITDFEKSLESFLEQKKAKQISRQLYGYGLPEATRATYCDKNSVILFFDGHIEIDKVAIFKIPIPISLAKTGRKTKRITITSSHLPEVQRWGVERYLGSTIKWRLFRGDADQDAILQKMSRDEDSDTEEGGSTGNGDHKEITKFHFKVSERSKGCIQHDYHEWSIHREQYSLNHYTLAVAAYGKWPRKQKAVPLAIVVKIEDESHSAPIYTDVASMISAQTEVTSKS